MITVGLGDRVQVQGKQYTVKKELGRGAYGQTFLAQTPSDQNLVALKQHYFGSNPSEWEREVDNLRMADRLIGYDALKRLIVQKYFEGPTVAQILRKLNRGDTKRAFRKKYLESVKRFHILTGLKHQDLHPGNGIYTKNDEIEWIDLGRSRLLSKDPHENKKERAEDLKQAQMLFDQYGKSL